MKYKNWFASVYQISNRTKRLLYERFGDCRAIYFASEKELLALPFCDGHTIEVLTESKRQFDLEKQLHSMGEKKIRLVLFGDDAYPKRLSHIHDAPFQIYYRGKLPKQGDRLIAMVGARRCSGYGRSMTGLFGEGLSRQGYGIISGMADGIDGISHRAALHTDGVSYAVLGCGVDVCYPAKNRDIYDELPKKGGLISEFAPGVAPMAAFFPRRNRIISGLADVVLVMEAREKSGSLITAMLALEQGKDIYALPGRISDELSCGTNKIIREGAGILCGIDQLLQDLREKKDWDVLPFADAPLAKLRLEKEEALVYSCLDFNAKTVDELAAETKLPLMTLLGILLHLCELHLAEECFINQYVKR